MQNFGRNIQPQRTSILKELSNGNAELGQAVGLLLNEMVTQSGITNPKAEAFEVLPNSWRRLADKPDKTPEDIKKLDDTLKEEIQSIAESYLLFIARETGNLTGKLDYAQYEAYQFRYRFGHYDLMNRPDYFAKIKIQIRNGFNKLSAHGELSGDNLIDKHDMAAYIYAMATKARRGPKNQFLGFQINGIITPEEYAVNEANLFAPEDNLFSLKMRIAYKILHNTL